MTGKTIDEPTTFGNPIVPGMLTQCAGSRRHRQPAARAGGVYFSQTLKFLRPVKIGDTITARVEVVETVRDRNRVRLRTECANDAGELVLVGEAWVMPPPAMRSRAGSGEAARPLARAA